MPSAAWCPSSATLTPTPNPSPDPKPNPSPTVKPKPKPKPNPKPKPKPNPNPKLNPNPNQVPELGHSPFVRALVRKLRHPNALARKRVLSILTLIYERHQAPCLG